VSNSSQVLSPPPQAFLELAEKIVVLLEKRSIDALVIGGYALAAHKYVRSTEDLDLGINTNKFTLEAIRAELEDCGYRAELRMPDANDALGGVIDVQDVNDAFVQIVNFDNSPGGGFPRAIRDALKIATPLLPSSRLRVIPLPHLVALKLYAGGRDSLSDIRELLGKNPDVDREALKRLCREYRLPTGDIFE
jgi:hypothetical protein